jgi:hypothetical protein
LILDLGISIAGKNGMAAARRWPAIVDQKSKIETGTAKK